MIRARSGGLAAAALFVALALGSGAAPCRAAAAPPPPQGIPVPKAKPLAPNDPRLLVAPLGPIPQVLPANPAPSGTCPQVFAGVTAGAFGTPGGAVYGSGYGENLGGGPGSINAQTSAILGTPCPPVGLGLPPAGTLDPPTTRPGLLAPLGQ